MASEADTEYTLYSYWRSTASWRVRICLEFSHMPYKVIPVNLIDNQQQSLEYSAVNPAHLLPTLVTKTGHQLYQSSSILEYLNETHSLGLLPTDAYSRSVVRSIVNMITCDVHPIQNLRVLKYVDSLVTKTTNATDSSIKEQWANHFITIGFEPIERMLEKTSGKYCVGDSISLADICLVPQMYNARRFNVDMGLYPLMNAIEERLMKELEFINGHPDNQMDKPK